jgi:predicted transcriptional regulator
LENSPEKKNTGNSVVEVNARPYFQHNQKDTDFLYISERVKKLITAVYLVTNLIPPTDPLRQSIREFSIKILSLTGRTPAGYSISEANQETKDLIQKVVGMLEVAFFSGYVSEMNYSVLKSEFDVFVEELSQYENAQETISGSSLKTDRQNPVSSQPTLPVPHPSPSSSASVPSTPYINRTNINKASNKVNSRNVVEVKKNSRREAILAIIKRRGEVNIKDISSVVINCSEKTIQRELLELVENGVVKKAGERRWSTYSLV